MCIYTDMDDVYAGEIWFLITKLAFMLPTKANYRYNYILGNDHSFFYFNYPDLSPVYDI